MPVDIFRYFGWLQCIEIRFAFYLLTSFSRCPVEIIMQPYTNSYTKQDTIQFKSIFIQFLVYFVGVLPNIEIVF